MIPMTIVTLSTRRTRSDSHDTFETHGRLERSRPMCQVSPTYPNTVDRG